MFSGNTLCLAWVVCVGVCMLPYIHGEPRYAGNCRKNFPADCTTPNTICGPPGNCPNNICQWKCHYCTCKKAQQCYLAGPDTTACNCTGTGYTGSTCEIDIDECASGPCKNGGKCCNGENRYDCFCAPGYTGTNCEIDIDECTLGNWCLNGGTCTNGINQYTCTCAPGFTGKNCETNINDCTSSPLQPPCKNGGTCVDGIDDYSCVCPAGFRGDICEEDIDECKLGKCAKCLNGGTCHDGINQYTCTCAPGFTGENCENDIDECESSSLPCQNGGVCVNGIDSYSCDCPLGFTGPHCETDVDECAGHNPCGGYSCSNHDGGYCCE